MTDSFSYLEPVCCSTFSSNCCFLACIQISQEAGQVVRHFSLFNCQQLCEAGIDPAHLTDGGRREVTCPELSHGVRTGTQACLTPKPCSYQTHSLLHQQTNTRFYSAKPWPWAILPSSCCRNSLTQGTNPKSGAGLWVRVLAPSPFQTKKSEHPRQT